VLSGALSALFVMTVGEIEAFAVCSSYLVGWNGFRFGLTDTSFGLVFPSFRCCQLGSAGLFQIWYQGSTLTAQQLVCQNSKLTARGCRGRGIMI
jgi:hypothetical protein